MTVNTAPLPSPGRAAGDRVFTRLLLVLRRDAKFKIDNNSIALDSRCDEGFGEPRVSSRLRQRAVEQGKERGASRRNEQASDFRFGTAHASST